MSAVRSRIKDNRPTRIGLFLLQNALVTAEAIVRPRHRRPAEAAASTYELAAMIRVKDEARFLPEWMAHHVNVGFQHIFVYDNNSTDGIEGVIAPFVERGLATYVPWAPVPASPSCDYDFLTRFGPRCRWAAFFDADEFLVESRTGELAAVLREHADHPAIAVCWRYFGSAGHETIPRGLVTEQFDRADALYNRHVKVIARPSQIVRHRNSHNFYYRHGRLAVTPDGHRVFGSFITPPTQARLELRHYVCRSREDYERKTRRGYVDAQSARDKSRNLAVADAEFRKRNDVRVEPDERTVRATAELLRELGYPDELYASPSADRAHS
jgi:hypothetical protein